MNPIVDLTYLETVCEGDRDFMKEMIEAFIDTIPKTIAELNEAALAGDLANVGRLAHKMKPSIAFMGIAPLKTLVHAIEDAAKNETPKNQITSLVKDVSFLADTALKELADALKTFE